MRVQEEQFKLKLPRDGSRSKGLHLSEVIRDLAFKTKVLDAKYKGEITEDSDTTLMQVGLGWEDYLARYQHPEIEFHPGELVLDGIAMSPDGFSMVDGDDVAELMGVEPGSWILHEFKFTRKSSRDFADAIRMRTKKALMWLWQIEAYRHAMNVNLGDSGIDPCYVSKLHVMFINGNYSRDDSDPDSKPSYKVYRITHTQEELEENWLRILTHEKGMRNGNGQEEL